MPVNTLAFTPAVESFYRPLNPANEIQLQEPPLTSLAMNTHQFVHSARILVATLS
jgi:hypothetical protein